MSEWWGRVRRGEWRAGLALAALLIVAITGSALTPEGPNRPTIERGAESAKTESPESSAEERIAIYTLWLAFFTGALVFVSAIQIRYLIRADVNARRALIETRRSTNRQSRETKASLAIAKKGADAAMAGQRAWLTLSQFLLVYPTKFTEQGAVIKVRVKVRNVGNTPATGAWVDASSYFGKGQTYRRAESAFIAKMRRVPSEWGRTVFPDDEPLVQEITWEVGPTVIEEAQDGRLPGERTTLQVTIFVGVVYRISGDPDAHLTFQVHENLNVPLPTVLSPPGGMMDMPGSIRLTYHDHGFRLASEIEAGPCRRSFRSPRLISAIQFFMTTIRRASI